MRLVDAHCHLDDAQFDQDRAQVIERALGAGVQAMLTIGSGDGPPGLEAAVKLAEEDPHIYATVGIHPHDASKASEETWRAIQGLLGHPKVLAVGEIGLDYHYNLSPPQVQRAVFIRQLELARQADKPIIVHTREAWADTLDILKRYWTPQAPACVMHCFSGGPEQAAACLDLGFYLSFAGVITFPKAVKVQQAARLVPVDRLLIETDAPYLAPVPLRGRRNEPAFVVHTARKLSELRGEDLRELAEATTRNFHRIFGLRSLPAAGADG